MNSHSSDWTILRRIVLQAKPFWPHIAAIFLLTLLSTPLVLLAPLPVKIVIDNVLGSKPLPAFLRIVVPASAQHSPVLLLAVAVGLLAGVTLLTHLQGLGTWLLETYAGEGMVLSFRSKLFAHVQRLSLGYHDSKGTADSVFRIQYDAPFIQWITINGVMPLFSAFLTLIGMIYVTARLDMELAVVAMGVSPILFLLAQLFGRRLRPRWRNVKRLESSANSLVQEVLASLRVVKAFGREDHERDRFLLRSKHRMRELIRVSCLQGGFDLLVGMTIALGTAATLYLGVLHVRSGVLSLGDLMLVIAYIAQLYAPLNEVSKKLADLQGGLASAERAFALLDETPDVIERPHARPILRSRGHVRFDDVCFTYDGERQVLRGVSFEAQHDG